MPPSIVDIVVKTHRVLVSHVYKNIPHCELNSELNFLSLRQNREKEGAVEAMSREADDQGEAAGVVASRDDVAERHLEPGPRSEDEAGLNGDDTNRNGASPCWWWHTRPLPKNPQLLQDIHICNKNRRDVIVFWVGFERCTAVIF